MLRKGDVAFKKVVDGVIANMMKSGDFDKLKRADTALQRNNQSAEPRQGVLSPCNRPGYP